MSDTTNNLPRPRAVIDTQILLRAVVNRRSIPAKIVYDLALNYILLVSEATIAEIEDVLNRPKIRKKFELTDEVVQELLVRLSRGERIEIQEVPAVSRDPKDDVFLACAVTGKAKYLVSEDKDLLVLHPYQGIEIIDALAFLGILQSQNL